MLASSVLAGAVLLASSGIEPCSRRVQGGAVLYLHTPSPLPAPPLQVSTMLATTDASRYGADGIEGERQPRW